MKANVCSFKFCDQCKHFAQQGDECRCTLDNLFIKWFQFACEYFEDASVEVQKEAEIEPEAIKWKTCPHCGQTKEIDAFSHNWATADGRQVWCKDCMNEKARATYQQRKK